MIHTRLTELFDLDYPVMSAPMSFHSGGMLAAAVSRAGGLGTFGATNLAGAEWVHEQIRYVRGKTERPFGVGFVAHFMSFFEANFDAALKERVPVIALSFGETREWIGKAKDAGATVICQIQRFDQGEQALAAGADVLVAQGNEAGGHTGTMAMLPLLTQTVEAHPGVPVLAAGGIASGRSLAAVLAAGAEGAWVGTAFLATPEAIEISDAYKQIIVNGGAEDTTYTSIFDTIETRYFDLPDWPAGIAARMYRNKFVKEWEGHEAQLADHLTEVLPRYDEARKRQDPEMTAIYMGQSASFVSSIRPAGDVLTSICNDAEKLLRERAKSLVR
ncbi:MAG: NAD(P)H-dependent flavin oxidoreductase [Gammaproteobacteria bacterium]